MRRKKKRHLEETSYWLSYSDMMAALLLIFVLIISFTMLQSQRRYEQKQEELKQEAGFGSKPTGTTAGATGTVRQIDRYSNRN